MKKTHDRISRKKPFRKKTRKMVVIVAAGSLLVSAACYTVFLAPLLEKEQWIYKEEIVERGILKIGVSESGSLEYGITSVLYDLDLDISGDEAKEEDNETNDDETVQKYLKIEEVYVKPSQRISEGDLLYQLAEDSINDVRMLLKNAMAEAQSEYAQAQTEYRLSALEAGTDYDIQMLDAQYASSIYQKTSQSIRNETAILQVEIDQRTANIASLQEKADEAMEAFNEASENFSTAEKPSVEDYNTENFMTLQKQYLSLQIQYENAKNAWNQATQELEDNARQIESLQNELASASAKSTIRNLDANETYQENIIQGENAQTSYNAQLENLKETLKEAEEKKDKIQEQLWAFEDFVGEDGCLYADGTGIVTEVNYEAGDLLREAGTMLSYAAPDDMTISVDVTQEDIVDLTVGDKVDITFTAYKDTSYEGSIYSINTTATSQESNTVSYTVVIHLEGDTSLLYGGMTADIVFVTEQKEDVLYISKKAIQEENGKTYVYYKTPTGEMDLKEVEVGIHNGVNIEILSGLEEGDTIYLASRVSSENAVMSSDSLEEDSIPEDGSGNREPGASDQASGMEGTPGGSFEGEPIPGSNKVPENGAMPGNGVPGGGEAMPGSGAPGGGEIPRSTTGPDK